MKRENEKSFTCFKRVDVFLGFLKLYFMIYEDVLVFYVVWIRIMKLLEQGLNYINEFMSTTLRSYELKVCTDAILPFSLQAYSKVRFWRN